MAINIGVIDYGMGNMHSVSQAFKRLGNNIRIVKTSIELVGCNALILPGVGSFDPAMKKLEQTNLIPYLKNWSQEKKPLLGICLGLQLLFESSDEGSMKGLGILKGHIEKLPTDQGERIPHMGWAPIHKKKNCPLFEEEINENWMYFVHSYAAIPIDQSDLAATALFGKTNVTAVVWKERIGACQFHPEKSSYSGEKMLIRWLQWLKNGADY